MGYVKRKQFFGPENRASLIVFREKDDYPALVSNGQWAVVGPRSLSIIPSILNLWLKSVQVRIEKGDIRLGDMTKPHFTKVIRELMRGEAECMHNWDGDVYEACFQPEPRQRELVYERLLKLDETATLIRRPLLSTSGAKLGKDGTPVAYAWEVTYPRPTTFWLYSEYVGLLAQHGGFMLEYAPDTRAALVKDKKNSLIGAIAPYHPRGEA